MAPYIPEEVDVFTVPHSRMKGLVNEYVEKLQTTNFSNVADLKILLDSLRDTFSEFKLHEQIENTLIMKRLKSKLKQLSIRNTMVCNCHKDSHLTDMMSLVQEGFAKKTEQDRLNYSRQLKKALNEFTEDFIPHMKQEEEVFQPMLLEYFTYEELCELKQKVIEWHLMKKDAQSVEKGLVEATEKEESDSCSDSEEDSTDATTHSEKNRQEIYQTSVLDLPEELTTEIFSYLNPSELTACGQVCSSWRSRVYVPELWREVHPRQWAGGNWNVKLSDLNDEEEEEDSDNEEEDHYQVIDDDADIDESADSEGDPDQTEQSKLLHREARILVGLVKYVLPSVGDGVKVLNLANCHALTNTILQRLLKLTPNMEYLNLSQTRISDSGLKVLGKNWCGANLRYLNLSGCRVSDKTLDRLRAALIINDDCNKEVEETYSNECLCEKKSREMKQSTVDKNTTPPVTGKNEGLYKKEIVDEDKDVDDSEPLLATDDHHGNDIVHYHNNQNQDDEEQEFQPFIENKTAVMESVDVPNLGHDPKDDPCHVQCRGHVESEEPDPIEDCAGPKRHPPDYQCNTKMKPPASSPFCTGYNPERRENIKGDKTRHEGVREEEEEEFVKMILKPPRMLSYLNLSGCYQVTDEGLRSLAKAGPLASLTFLDLSGCLMLTGEGLHRLTAECPNLQHHTFFYCDNILDGPYSTTASGCQNLECSRRMCCRKGE